MKAAVTAYGAYKTVPIVISASLQLFSPPTSGAERKQYFDKPSELSSTSAIPVPDNSNLPIRIKAPNLLEDSVTKATSTDSKSN